MKVLVSGAAGFIGSHLVGFDVLAEQAGDVGQTCADVSKARRLLGYDASVSIEEGIGRFVAWFREHEERLV